MKIVHFIAGLNASSGVSVFVIEVANIQAENKHDVTVVYTDNDSYKPSSKVHLVHAKSLDSLNFIPDIVHIHALWMICLVKAMKFCYNNEIPFIISPHGGLMPRVFEKGKIKKYIFWHFILCPLLKHSSAIHCTGNAEVEACEKLGLKGPFCIAPLGVHLPDFNKLYQYNNNFHTVLFLGRISEEKGLINLLEAWRHIRNSCTKYNNWILKISGPDWRGFKEILEKKIKNECINDIEFTGPADKKLKDKLYRSADIFVLPSPMENFSVVVLEALSYGVPAIATKGTPWRELESENCGLWIDQGVKALEEALVHLMSISDYERATLGNNGRRLASSKYQWPKIADNLVNFYKSICR